MRGAHRGEAGLDVLQETRCHVGARELDLAQAFEMSLLLTAVAGALGEAEQRVLDLIEGAAYRRLEPVAAVLEQVLEHAAHARWQVGTRGKRARAAPVVLSQRSAGAWSARRHALNASFP